MIELFANNAQTTLAGAISNTSLTVTLSPGSGSLFPNPTTGQFFRMTFIPASTGIPGEIVYCTARSGDVCTIQRGQESTVAAAYSAGDTAANLPTAGAMTNLTQEQQIQQNLYNYAADTGTANSHIVTLNPTSLSTPVSGAPISFKAANTNTGASTLTVNGGTSYPIYGKAGSALQGGEIVANGFYTVTWNSTSSVYVLAAGAGALQIAPATASQHAVQLGQVAGVVGSVRNLVMSVTTASASATLTADEIVVETALGGLRYCLPSFSKTINLATTGAGGMDTGSAPVSGFVALYAIYNPTTGTAALLATNATSAIAPNVYGGANMPSGYTASALVSVWPTNSSSQFVQGLQRDRLVNLQRATAVSSSSQVPSFTSVSISSIVPKNALSVGGWLSCTGASANNLTCNVASDATGLGYQQLAVSNGSANSYSYVTPFKELLIETAQTIYWLATVTAGTFTSAYVSIDRYTF